MRQEMTRSFDLISRDFSLQGRRREHPASVSFHSDPAASAAHSPTQSTEAGSQAFYTIRTWWATDRHQCRISQRLLWRTHTRYSILRSSRDNARNGWLTE